MKKVLLVGGAGFIGSHTCVSLMEAGHEVVVLDNLSNATSDVLDRVARITGRSCAFYHGDMQNEALLAEIFAAHQFDAVVQLAGLKAVGESVSKPLEYYTCNLGGTLALCKAMRDAECFNLIFSSSATVYGMTNEPPYTEDMPLSATNPYGQTKVMLEQILQDLAVSDERWHIVALRYFNPIGAHESGLIGEKPAGVPNNLLPYVSEVACGRLPCLRVFGNDYPTPDGTGVRDYIHVVDLAEGHVSALDYTAAHAGYETINLGTGEGYSVLEIVHAFEKASGRAVPYEIVARRPGDIASCTASVDKAARLLGWHAKRDLDDMCRDGWRFISQNGAAGQ